MKLVLSLSALSAIALTACTPPTPQPICNREVQVWDKFESVEDECVVSDAPVPFFSRFKLNKSGPAPVPFTNDDSSDDNQSDREVLSETEGVDAPIIVGEAEIEEALPESSPDVARPTPTVTTSTPTEITQTETAASPTPAPADQTPAPADPTPAPADPTPAPADPTPAPADPTPATADPTPAPADPTPVKPGPPPGFSDP